MHTCRSRVCINLQITNLDDYNFPNFNDSCRKHVKWFYPKFILKLFAICRSEMPHAHVKTSHAAVSLDSLLPVITPRQWALSPKASLYRLFDSIFALLRGNCSLDSLSADALCLTLDQKCSRIICTYSYFTSYMRGEHCVHGICNPTAYACG